jgi:hypothetical protein
MHGSAPINWRCKDQLDLQIVAAPAYIDGRFENVELIWRQNVFNRFQDGVRLKFKKKAQHDTTLDNYLSFEPIFDPC